MTTSTRRLLDALATQRDTDQTDRLRELIRRHK